MTETKPTYLRSCLHCGATFAVVDRGQKRRYCSSICKDRARNKRLPARKSRPTVSATDGPTIWIPKPGSRTPSDATQRRRLIQQWAAAGYSSRQMSELLGSRVDVIRQIAREIGVVIPADEVIGKSRHHDSGQILRETAQALEGLVMGAGLVNLSDVDPAEAKTWATSMTGSLRVLSQFANQVKEVTQ